MKEKKLIPVIIIVFVLAAILIKLDDTLNFISKVIGIFTPVLSGFIIAVILSPFEEKIEDYLTPKLKLSKRTLRCVSVFALYFLIIFVLSLFIIYLVPNLFKSVKLFAESFDDYYGIFMKRLNKMDTENFSYTKFFGEIIGYFKKNVPETIQKIISVMTDFFSKAAEIIISVVISVYLLLDKETALNVTEKILNMILGEEKMYTFVKYMGLFTGCFSRFIYGQITESLVLGVLCFIGNVIFNFDYPLLISSIIGITALIPVIGAFIGTVPCAVMLFMVSPAKAVWFIVFIIVLQQIEGNFIYPKVVGKSVGLPPIIILTGVFAGARLGGAMGILIAIPIFSALFIILKEKISDK